MYRSSRLRSERKVRRPCVSAAKPTDAGTTHRTRAARIRLTLALSIVLAIIINIIIIEVICLLLLLYW